jgi:hypothetical protein
MNKAKINTNWRGYRIAAWGGQCLLTITVLVTAAQGKWKEASALAIFLLASFAFVALENQLPTLFDMLFVLAALLNAGGWVWGLFYLPGPYDEITHAFTIFSITLALSFLVYGSLLTSFKSHRLLYVLTIASFGIAIGAVWEVAEWLAGKILPSEVIGSLDDTIMDLVMDTLGAGLAALLSLWVLKDWVRSTSTGANQQADVYSRSHRE